MMTFLTKLPWYFDNFVPSANHLLMKNRDRAESPLKKSSISNKVHYLKFWERGKAKYPMPDCQYPMPGLSYNAKYPMPDCQAQAAFSCSISIPFASVPDNNNDRSLRRIYRFFSCF